MLLDPSYDSYAPIVRAAGGEVVALPLVPPEKKKEEGEDKASTSPSSSWSLPPKRDLEEAIGDRHTKLVVVNSPHNPTGKVFTSQELELIAGIVREKHPDGRCLLLLDEVYQHLVHPSPPAAAKKKEEEEGGVVREEAGEGAAAAAAAAAAAQQATAAKSGDGVGGESEENGRKNQYGHISLASLPDMAQRSVRVGSAGKTFSLTGFKIGWATSSNPALTSALFRAHQFLTFCCPPCLQAGVAAGFEECSSYFLTLGSELAEKRKRLEGWVTRSGFTALPAEGTYFLVADARRLMKTGETDAEFCVRLAVEGGVAAIPLSAFYNDKGRAPRTLVRFCFCKRDEVLDEGGRRLEAFWEKQQQRN